MCWSGNDQFFRDSRRKLPRRFTHFLELGDGRVGGRSSPLRVESYPPWPHSYTHSPCSAPLGSAARCARLGSTPLGWRASRVELTHTVTGGHTNETHRQGAGGLGSGREGLGSAEADPPLSTSIWLARQGTEWHGARLVLGVRLGLDSARRLHGRSRAPGSAGSTQQSPSRPASPRPTPPRSACPAAVRLPGLHKERFPPRKRPPSAHTIFTVQNLFRS